MLHHSGTMLQRSSYATTLGQHYLAPLCNNRFLPLRSIFRTIEHYSLPRLPGNLLVRISFLFNFCCCGERTTLLQNAAFQDRLQFCNILDDLTSHGLCDCLSVRSKTNVIHAYRAWLRHQFLKLYSPFDRRLLAPVIE